jgi:hypothetical protein
MSLLKCNRCHIVRDSDYIDFWLIKGEFVCKSCICEEDGEDL